MKRGTVKWTTGRDGIKYVEVPDEEAPKAVEAAPGGDSREMALARKHDADAALKLARIRGIEAEIRVKSQKVREYRERLRREFCEGVLECFSDSFGDLKAVLVDMRLRKDQVQKFRDEFGRCLKRFGDGLEKYLKQMDDAEEEEARAESEFKKELEE